MTVAAILKHKGARVETTRPNVTLQQVCDQLSAKRIGAAVVLGAAGEIVGMVSERDVVQAVGTHGGNCF